MRESHLVLRVVVGFSIFLMIWSWGEISLNTMMIKEIPSKQYEKLIVLEKPQPGTSPVTIVGIIYVEKGGKITTDYVYKREAKSFSELNDEEKRALSYMTKIIIKDSKGYVHGYAATLPDTTNRLWEEKDGTMKLQVTVDSPPVPLSKELR